MLENLLIDFFLKINLFPPVVLHFILRPCYQVHTSLELLHLLGELKVLI